jgi:hypothetical protein
MIVIERGRIDEILNIMTIQILKATDAGTIMDAQRVAGNKIADLVFETAKSVFTDTEEK